MTERAYTTHFKALYEENKVILITFLHNIYVRSYTRYTQFFKKNNSTLMVFGSEFFKFNTTSSYMNYCIPK